MANQKFKTIVINTPDVSTAESAILALEALATATNNKMCVCGKIYCTIDMVEYIIEVGGEIDG